MTTISAFAIAFFLLPVFADETRIEPLPHLRQTYDAKVLRVNGCRQIRSGTSSCRITVQVENTGTTDWDSASFRLVGRIVKGPSGSPVQRDELAHDNTKVSLEARRRDFFTYEVEGVPYLGRYEIEWCMARSNGRRFGDCMRREITVVE